MKKKMMTKLYDHAGPAGQVLVEVPESFDFRFFIKFFTLPK